MRAILGCGLAVVLALAASAGAEDKKGEKVDGKLLMGKWTPKDAPKGATISIEFLKDNKLSLSFDFAGKSEKIAGTYKLDGDKLTVTMAEDGKEKTEVMTVLKLTEAELTTKDPKGKEETLVRAKAKP